MSPSCAPIVPVLLYDMLMPDEGSPMLSTVEAISSRGMMRGISRWMAQASSSVMVSWLPEPIRAPPDRIEPDRTMIMLEPISGET